MEVGQNIAVIGNDEAGAGCGGGGLEAPEIGGHGSGDTHGGVDIGGIDRCRSHQLSGFYFHHFNHRVFPDALHDVGNLLLRGVGCFLCLEVLHQQYTAHTHSATKKRTDKH